MKDKQRFLDLVGLCLSWIRGTTQKRGFQFVTAYFAMTLMLSLSTTFAQEESNAGASIRLDLRIVFRAHDASVRHVAFSPDGKYVVSGSEDGTLKVWNLDEVRVVGVLKGHTDWVFCSTFLGNNDAIASVPNLEETMLQRRYRSRLAARLDVPSRINLSHVSNRQQYL